MDTSRLIGMRVVNVNTHAIGTIEYIKDRYVAIDFHGDINKYAYPSSFAKMFELEDEILQEQIQTEGVGASFEMFKRDCKFAINSEIEYLKVTGGKKYRIIDGEKLPSKNGEYLYVFDTDTEMHYPDGTAIKLWFPDNIVTAYVVSCEDFTILIRTMEYIGEFVESVEFTSEQWQLLESLMDRLDEMEPRSDSIAYEIACNGRRQISQWNSIRSGQNYAFNRTTTEKITFIWGPPGTGKTETLSNIAIEHILKGRRVLMLSSGKVKGKIVIGKNIRANIMHGRNDRFYCQYLRFSDDIIENQILKAALKKAKRFIADYFADYSKDNNYASMISYCSNTLRHISDIQCKGNVCDGLKFTGCYTYYKPVIAMARMILDDISIESNGEISTTGYIVPYAISMEKLFEVYVRAYLKKNGIASYRNKCDVGIKLEKFDDKTDVFLEEEGLTNPGKYISGSIKPDLILTDQQSGERVVFDVKYKDYTNGNSRDDRLQLLAYGMMMNANNIGIILPAQDDVEIFDARTINSMENRVIRYHQMLLGMMNDNPTIARYIKDSTFKKESK